jgi:CHASE1-domain containing sensor protein/two-component sensor histidine kinase
MQRTRRDLIPLLVFLLGLMASLAAAAVVSQVAAARRTARFEMLADNAVSAIRARMLAQLTLLRATAGFFTASTEVTPDEFRRFVARLRLNHYYAGVLGMGYAEYLPDQASLVRFERETRAAGLPGYHVWPDGPRRDYSAIRYLEPLNERNRFAIGYDMLSEPTRRAAMEAARFTDEARVSGRVRLVQEIGPAKQPGFLIYLALFGRSGSGSQLRGWVYSPLRAYDLFGAIFAERDLSQLTIEVFDQQPGEDHLLYRSGTIQPHPSVQRIRRIEIGGQTWVVRLTSTPSFDDEQSFPLPALVVAGGALVSLLVAILMSQQLRARMRTEHEVEARTAELRDANARMSAEATARADAEAQVRQMQKMEAIGQLTGGIAHDFNNMLAVVLGNLDIAERRADDPDKVRRAVSHAREGATRAAQLTQRLLAFGRRQSLDPHPIDVNALIRGMAELLHRALGEAIKLDTRLAENLWRSFADSVQLENAILNLVINARDAMPGGGTVTVSTANVHGVTESEKPHDFVSISVRDTGHGMSDDVAARAVEPFFTTKEIGRGTGLGLSQVFGFVTQSGGSLQLDTAPGQGTTVTILLPRDRRRSKTARLPGDEDDGLMVANGRPDEVVLVVEDEEQVRSITVEMLRELGYTVIEAANGEDALAELKQRPDVALLFTDLIMPGMNGRDLAALARQQRPELRVLYATGYAPDEMLGSERDLPVLRKPFESVQLARAVRQVLDD